MMQPTFEAELDWAVRHMPRLSRALAALPDLSGMRLACSVHLDLKMVPLMEGLLERGARLFLVPANTHTTRDRVVERLKRSGAQVEAYAGMPSQDAVRSIAAALDWGPTHLCELGGDLTAALRGSNRLSQVGKGPLVRAGLEGTGSGIARLEGAAPDYPIYNWDDLPVKEGLHNRHMVGLSTWHTFFSRTLLTLHGKEVAVIGYGLVGQGVAATARAYGGTVTIVERDPVRRLQAAYDGWPIPPLEEAAAFADVIVTATGVRGVLRAEHFDLLKEGVFLINVGHRADEIDVEALLAHPHREALPFIEEIQIGSRQVYLFAGGSMANLTAGEGDSLNAFDLTLAVLTAGIGYIAGPGAEKAPGIYLLPRDVWESVI